MTSLKLACQLTAERPTMDFLLLALTIQVFFIGLEDEKIQKISNQKLLLALVIFFILYPLTWSDMPGKRGCFLSSLLHQVLAGLAFLFLFFLLSFFSQGRFGMGDAKLSALIVLYLGLGPGLSSLFLTYFFTFIRALARRKKAVPMAFQAFLACSTLLVFQLIL